ncbi:MAG: DNA mismatch repair protein MutS [Chlamydiales bacterium]
MTTLSKPSPMMEQWHQCKEQAPDAVLLFRMGDFYEAFYDDAAILAKELELTLTKRQEIPMSGIPWHTSEGYVDKLLEKGYRVAIAEQIEDPKQAKGLVKRAIVRIVTPGSVIQSSLLKEKDNNFCVSLVQVNRHFGLCCVDLSTGECRVQETEHLSDCVNELHRLKPAEIIVSKRFFQQQESLFNDLKLHYPFIVTELEPWRFEYQLTCQFLTTHFQVSHLEGFGLNGMTSGVVAAGSLLGYLKDVLCHNIEHVTEIQTYSVSHYMSLDIATQRNLELSETKNHSSKQHSLVGVLDQTLTPMGGRLLRQWIKQPLLDPQEISRRQDCVEAFLNKKDIFDRLKTLLDMVKDLERLITKVSSGYATPRDLVAIKNSILPIPEIKMQLEQFQAQMLKEFSLRLNPLPALVNRITSVIEDSPSIKVGDGNVVREGFHAELDELRTIRAHGARWMQNYQTKLREELDIKTLKVGYNKMFGYFIEVSRGQSSKMPDIFQRRQTLVNTERFLSPELKEYETKVLTAEEKISTIEQEIFLNLRNEVAAFKKEILHNAQTIAALDVLMSFSSTALRYQYTKPQVNESRDLWIKDGRHPVIEASLLSETFVPNDTLLDDTENRMFIITGPNMAGKSTYIRQVALIVILAQIGSYVPASEARIGIVDKIFTRIGASDDLARGRSTFMVEMSETANILHNATDRSLVVLDEIGRGTSTYDGISIAWSVAEYLLLTEGKQAKTLFATHYCELTQLEDLIPGVVNYNVAVQEVHDSIVFLRKILRGGTDKSYGIHVARLAGMPQWVIERAKDLLSHLETNNQRKNRLSPIAAAKQPTSKQKIIPNHVQLSLFQ